MITNELLLKDLVTSLNRKVKSMSKECLKSWKHCLDFKTNSEKKESTQIKCCYFSAVTRCLYSVTSHPCYLLPFHWRNLSPTDNSSLNTFRCVSSVKSKPPNRSQSDLPPSNNCALAICCAFRYASRHRRRRVVSLFYICQRAQVSEQHLPPVQAARKHTLCVLSPSKRCRDDKSPPFFSF